MESSGIYSEDFQLICKNIHNLFLRKMENHLIEEYRYDQLQNIEIVTTLNYQNKNKMITDVILQ